MTDKEPAKPSQPQTAGGASKVPIKNPREAHPLGKMQPHRPGGHGFNPGNFAPKPIRNRNMGRSR